MLRSVDSDNNQTEETNMGIEQAITDHAAAIRELAAAIRGAASSNLATAVVGDPALVAMRQEHEAAELEKSVTKVENEAKAEHKKVMAMVEADRKSAAKQAVAEALTKAKAEKEAAKPASAPEPEDDPLDAALLDWDKDVRPALLAVGKDRDALVKLMAKYDVPKGGKAPAEKWADLLAEANAIVAARG